MELFTWNLFNDFILTNWLKNDYIKIQLLFNQQKLQLPLSEEATYFFTFLEEKPPEEQY